MPSVFDSLKTAPFDRAQEHLAPNEAFHVPDLALDHAAAPCLGGVEELGKPDFGGEMVEDPCHAPSMRISWLIGA